METIGGTKTQVRHHLKKLGLHHFAYMRAVVNGIDRSTAAERFLNIDHGNQTPTAHRELVETLQRIARRQSKNRWRLLGLKIESKQATDVPSMHDWAESNGLNDDWSEVELQAMYAEAFPPDRKVARNARLIQEQLALLRELELTAAENPKPDDEVAGWIDDLTAERLASAGVITLNDLYRAIQAPGWWSKVPAIGEGKAARLEEYFQRLCSDVEFPALPPAPPPAVSRFAPVFSGAPPSAGALPPPSLPSNEQDSLALAQVPPSSALILDAKDDAAVIDQWIAARTKNVNTKAVYRREAERLALWLKEVRGKSFTQFTVADAIGYMSFLEDIPSEWIAKGSAKRYQPGWAPFQGQLSADSRKQAINIVSGLFAWMAKGNYVQGNAWDAINKSQADDRDKPVHETRAFTPAAWAEIVRFVEQQDHSLAKARMKFVLLFTEATGLRASELLGAKLGDILRVEAGWALSVYGKGGKRARVGVPSQALTALDEYLASRGLMDRLSAATDVPLIVDAVKGDRSVTYQALYKSTKTWFMAAINNSDLTQLERQSLRAASLHWLRHTCGTRALERDVPLHVVQAQLRHKDPRTTMRYAKAQIEAVVTQMEKAFTSSHPPSPTDD